MDENTKLLKMSLTVLAVLAVLGALWRVLSYHPNSASARSFSSYTQEISAIDETLEPLNQGVVNELLDEPAPVSSPAHRSVGIRHFSSEVSPVLSYPQSRVHAKDTKFPAGWAANDGRYVELPAQSPSYQNSMSTPKKDAVGYRSPTVNFDNSSQVRVQEERARMLAPYLRPNGQEKARMDARWNKMSAALARAVAKALTPKSKREEMIEKYTTKSTEDQPVQTVGFAGALAPVGEQLAVQKQSVMRDMGSAFGHSAAQQAGGIMDAFSAEVANALNNSEATSQQKEKQVQAIAKKYQEKLDKLAEKNQYDKFVANRIEQDNKQKAELGALYPEEKAQINQLIDQTREKDLALATQNLPRDEYFNQLAQNNQQLRSGIAQLVVQGGKSVQEFHQWEQDKNREQLKKLAELEEKGQIKSVALVANADERKQTQAEIEVQGSDILEEAVKHFGEESKADFQSILNNYEQQLKQIDEEKLSIAERATKKANAMNEANRQLIDLRIQKIQESPIPEEQKQAIIEKYRQDYNNIH